MRDGHVYAPVQPYATALADRTWYDGNRLVITRDGRTVYVIVRMRVGELDSDYVPLAALVRELGERSAYRHGELDIQTAPRAAISYPTPIPNGALIGPRVVFTPTPVATPRPVWNGPALPRRTPLPYASPLARSACCKRAKVAAAEAARFRRR
ncbi:MAG TPA: hypothetical protein VNF68_02560 [Candidatus Baltobacteraceae bacterium]|nr:hypothetical protein [Candidatus Baltobacteraceae bacterium]